MGDNSLVDVDKAASQHSGRYPSKIVHSLLTRRKEASGGEQFSAIDVSMPPAKVVTQKYVRCERINIIGEIATRILCRAIRRKRRFSDVKILVSLRDPVAQPARPGF